MRSSLWWAAVVLVCTWATIASAAGPRSVRQQVQASMLVSAEIDIDAEGRVSGYLIGHPKKLSTNVTRLLARAVPFWKFAPTLEHGQAVGRSARAHIRLVLSPSAAGGHVMRVTNAHFSGFGSDGPSADVRTHPRYPPDLIRRGVGGAVYLVLKVGREGAVEDVIAEQVNLRVVASENEMDRMRAQFARAAEHAARGWTFKPPTSGPERDASHWSVRIPVGFTVGPPPDLDGEGRWVEYVPGPRQPIPWEPAREHGPDALPMGGVYSSGGTGPRLLTALHPD